MDCQGTQKLWVREGNTFKAYAVKTGITNGTRTQILSGVKEGTAVIVDLKEQDTEALVDAENGEKETQEKSPFAPGPRGKKK